MTPVRRLPVVPQLIDRQERVIRYLRISLTDRCNYRCAYCMPADGVELVPRSDVLQFEEIERLARLFAGLGVARIRLTGGEPTVRRGVVDLVARLRAIEGIDAVVMTSNAHLLPTLAEPLAQAGLREVNVSLDTLDPQVFRALTRRGDLARVVAGIDAAIAAGLRVKLNAVAVRGVTEDSVVPLCEFAWQRGISVRFIEHMPMSDGALFDGRDPLAAAEIRDRIGEAFGCVPTPVESAGPVGPARYFIAGSPQRRFGIISAMSEHFCATCNRVRLSSTGALHTCLAYDDASELRPLLRGGASDEQIVQVVRAALRGKRDGHQFSATGGGGPGKHMVSIGG